ncbi:hypothetical protein AB3X89_39775, partial [Paraburkholderia sp. BR14320]
VEALYCKPSTSRRNAQHKVCPYLLRGMKIERANQAWALDTTYVVPVQIGSPDEILVIERIPHQLDRPAQSAALGGDN